MPFAIPIWRDGGNWMAILQIVLETIDMLFPGGCPMTWRSGWMPQTTPLLMRSPARSHPGKTRLDPAIYSTKRQETQNVSAAGQTPTKS